MTKRLRIVSVVMTVMLVTILLLQEVLPHYIISVVMPVGTLCGIPVVTLGLGIVLYYFLLESHLILAGRSLAPLTAFIVSSIVAGVAGAFLFISIFIIGGVNGNVSLFRFSSEQTVPASTKLEKSIDRLLSTLSEPNNLTLAEIKSVVTETQVVLNQLRMETGEKIETLASIEKELKEARKSGLTEEQYKTIKDALGRSSRGRGMRGFIFGVLASLTAMLIAYAVKQGIKKSRL